MGILEIKMTETKSTRAAVKPKPLKPAEPVQRLYVNVRRTTIFPLGKPIQAGETILLTKEEAAACPHVSLADKD